MSFRVWVYQTLLNDSVLTGFHGGRVFQGGALTTAKTPKPFLVYHIGNDTDENMSEADSTPHRQFFQVYAHDKVGDYSQIDAVLDRVKTLLHGASSPGDHLMIARFLERSQDFDDEVLGTIFRYSRFQAVFGQ